MTFRGALLARGALFAMLFLILVLGVVVYGLVNASPSSTSSVNCANPCTIVITARGFDDGKLVVISKGTLIQWYNQDSISHSLIGIGMSFATGIITPGQTSKPIVLPLVGTFEYYCQTTMFHGEIQVVS
jgi:plastocyanin